MFFWLDNTRTHENESEKKGRLFNISNIILCCAYLANSSFWFERMRFQKRIRFMINFLRPQVIALEFNMAMCVARGRHIYTRTHKHYRSTKTIQLVHFLSSRDFRNCFISSSNNGLIIPVCHRTKTLMALQQVAGLAAFFFLYRFDLFYHQPEKNYIRQCIKTYCACFCLVTKKF